MVPPEMTAESGDRVVGGGVRTLISYPPPIQSPPPSPIDTSDEPNKPSSAHPEINKPSSAADGYLRRTQQPILPPSKAHLRRRRRRRPTSSFQTIPAARTAYRLHFRKRRRRPNIVPNKPSSHYR
ncbi:E3 ubiquitin-protein ligase RNF25 [Striga asiatica]|uniref:E3 ubiquitin-protein ligase RNF25 n=1 Tax=Striga asiatica TaxID=4170 RepID=A0A5A7PX61_STRAF|nr:E3 ubiquitin-protein ligase RNF25 [Striga asiatica]